MADEKLNPGQQTTVTASDQLSAITPSTTTNSTSAPVEKKGTINLEFGPHSGISTPGESNGNPFDTDLEAATPNENDNLRVCKKADRSSRHDPNCTVWPGQDHWRKQAKAAKIKNRSCRCMAKYSKRTRTIIKICVILLVIAIGVGVGFGVSKPLGAGIWKPDEVAEDATS